MCYDVIVLFVYCWDTFGTVALYNRKILYKFIIIYIRSLIYFSVSISLLERFNKDKNIMT